jgi:hypothetical protein
MLRGTFEWLAAALASGDVAAVEQVLSAEASASVSSGELQELVECFASTGAITIEAADFEVDPPTQRPRTARVAVTLDEPATTTATWVFVDQGEPNNHDWRLSELPACPAPTT